MQNAAGHTAVEHPGQASPTVTHHSDDICMLPLRLLYDGLHGGAVHEARSSPNTFLDQVS